MTKRRGSPDPDRQGQVRPPTWQTDAGADAGTEGDGVAFLDAMRGVSRLKGPRRVALGPPPAQGARRAAAAERLARGSGEAGRAGLSGEEAPPGWDAFTVEVVGETWTARANGVDRKLVRKLGAGQLGVEARIDLHGRSRDETGRGLERFLAQALAAGQRAVLVIHGRGLHSSGDGPTLRDVVREALTGRPLGAHVLACSSAPPALGGPGATLVWLRRAPSETRP
jgi:DNA-nicking Smr family endonuclease